MTPTLALRTYLAGLGVAATLIVSAALRTYLAGLGVAATLIVSATVLVSLGAQLLFG